MRRSEAVAKRQAAFTPVVIEQLQTLEQQLGGRSELVGLLMLAPLTPDLQYILGLLGTPSNSQKTLATICAEGNLTPGQLLQHLEASALLRGKVLSAQVVSKTLPAVVQDIMQKAVPFEAACSNCQGTATITQDPTPDTPNPSPEPCPVCIGTGRLVYQPNLERQKLALEMGRMLPKGGGILIQQNNQNGGGGAGTLGGGTLEQITRLTDRLLYEDAIDGEITPQEDPDAGEV